MRGVEPPRAEAHRHLKPARLPIPPHPQRTANISDFRYFVKGLSENLANTVLHLGKGKVLTIVTSVFLGTVLML